ncbi:MAG: LysR substrate-binding domain-containing protein, partial [Plesiomonas sp.]
KHPNINIEFKSGYDGYGDFDGDILLTCVLPKNESLIATKISCVQKTFFASPDYLAKHGVPKSIFDLSSHKVLYVKNPFYPDIGESYSSDVFKINNNVVYSDVAQALRVALNGNGILWTSTYLIENKVEQGALNMLFDDSVKVDLIFYAVYKPRFIQPHKIMLFIKELKNYIQILQLNN